MCVAFLTLYSPCRRNLDHHLGSLQSDLGSIGLLVLNLRSIDNHLTGHRNTLLLAILTFPAISFHYCDLSSEKKKRLCWIAAKFFCHFLFYFPRSFFFSNCWLQYRTIIKIAVKTDPTYTRIFHPSAVQWSSALGYKNWNARPSKVLQICDVKLGEYKDTNSTKPYRIRTDTITILPSWLKPSFTTI